MVCVCVCDGVYTPFLRLFYLTLSLLNYHVLCREIFAKLDCDDTLTEPAFQEWIASDDNSVRPIDNAYTTIYGVCVCDGVWRVSHPLCS